MSYEQQMARAVDELGRARDLIHEELRSYPTPVSGCDAQYNHLIATRNSAAFAIDALATLPFVATPRTPSPNAGVESR
jgi:hypothetical protein